jgi:HAMP domain-containing protein
MVANDRLSEGESRQILEQQIVPVVLAGIAPCSDPRAILVGGQPGSGKSQLLRLAQSSFGGPDSAVTINGDELRYFHPGYDRFVREHELTMPDRTAPEVSIWVENLVDLAASNRLNVIIEGTFRRPGVTLKTTTDLIRSGYRVDAWAIGLHEWQSRLGILTRYFEMKRGMGWGRWSPRIAHDTSYHAMSSTLVALEASGTIERFTAHRRDGTIIAEFEGPLQVRGSPQFHSIAAAVLAERTRSWSELELNEFLEGIDRLQRMRPDIDPPQEVSNELERLVAEVREMLTYLDKG